MTDQNAVRDDIAFMRTLAEEGRAGAPLGGSILIASGLSFGSASLAIWAGVTWRLLHHDWEVAAIWTASLVVFLGYLFIAKAAWGEKKKGATPRAVGIAWSGAGWSIFFVGLSLAVMAVHGHDAYVANAFMPFILAIYGSCWFVAAALSRARWLYAVAFGSFGMAVLAAWFAANGLMLYLVYGLSLYGLGALPGLVLTLQARARTA